MSMGNKVDIVVEPTLLRALEAWRLEIDSVLARADSARRTRDKVLSRLRKPVRSWPRIAAGVLVAGLLGGALDLALLKGSPADATADTTDLVLLDPLGAAEALELR